MISAQPVSIAMSHRGLGDLEAAFTPFVGFAADSDSVFVIFLYEAGI